MNLKAYFFWAMERTVLKDVGSVPNRDYTSQAVTALAPGT